MLFQIFADSMIVGKITVVNQGFIQPDERMGPAGMPDPTFGGVALMCDPAVGLKILEKIVLGHLFGIADDFQDHDISAVGEDKGLLLSQRRIKLLIETEGVLIDKFVFSLAGIQILKLIFLQRSILWNRQNPWAL